MADDWDFSMLRTGPSKPTTRRGFGVLEDEESPEREPYAWEKSKPEPVEPPWRAGPPAREPYPWEEKIDLDSPFDFSMLRSEPQAPEPVKPPEPPGFLERFAANPMGLGLVGGETPTPRPPARHVEGYTDNVKITPRATPEEQARTRAEDAAREATRLAQPHIATSIHVAPGDRPPPMHAEGFFMDPTGTGHPTAVPGTSRVGPTKPRPVGGFDLNAGTRIPQTKRATREELIFLGVDPATALRLSNLPEPPSTGGAPVARAAITPPAEPPPTPTAPVLSTTHTLSPRGYEKIREREGGFYAQPYHDSAERQGELAEPGDTGNLAIGYGMQEMNGEKVTPEMRITKEEADAEFQRQLREEKAPIVDRHLKVPVTQDQYDSLVSMAWNLPAAAKAIINKLNAGQTLTDADFQSHVHSGGKPNAGLIARRKLEAEPFLRPAATAAGGLLVPGNIDLYAQPKVKNPDGKISTVDSSSYNLDGVETLLPSVTPDGRHLQTPEQIVTEYRKTGRHLGKFATPEAADAYAKNLHEEYEAGKYDRKVPRPDGWTATDEARFQTWYGDWAQRYHMNPDPDAAEQFYDYRGAYRKGVTPPNVAQGEHWPSDDKAKGHPNEIVGGFNTKTGERDARFPRATSVKELVEKGWDRETAERLMRLPEPPSERRRRVVRGGFDVQTKERVLGTKRGNQRELVRLGWSEQDAKELAATPEPEGLPTPEGRAEIEKEFGPDTLGPETKTWGELATDYTITGVKGAMGITEGALGVADIVATPARALTDALTQYFHPERAGERSPTLTKGYQDLTGSDFKATRDILNSYYSDQQQFANRSVAEADGVLNKAIAALSHPSVIFHSVVESAPLILAGGAVGRAATALKAVAPWVAGALGEGVTQAGAAASQQIQESGDLTGKQALLATTSGAVTGSLSLFGGWLAQKLKIADIDTLLAAGATNEVARRGLVAQIIFGAVQEGFLEELPQSVQEQVHQNIMAGRPWSEGVSDAAVMGALTGALMSGGTQGYQRVVEGPVSPGLRAARARWGGLKDLGYEDRVIAMMSTKDVLRVLQEKTPPGQFVPTPPEATPPPSPPAGTPPPGGPPDAARQNDAIRDRAIAVLVSRGLNTEEELADMPLPELMTRVREAAAAGRPTAEPPAAEPAPPATEPAQPEQPVPDHPPVTSTVERKAIPDNVVTLIHRSAGTDQSGRQYQEQWAVTFNPFGGSGVGSTFWYTTEAEARERFTQEVDGATTTGEQPEGRQPEHPGTPPVGETPETGRGDQPGERPTTPEGGPAQPEGAGETPEGGPDRPKVAPWLIVENGVAIPFSSPREMLPNYLPGRKQVVVERQEDGTYTVLKAGDQISPDDRAKAKRGEFQMHSSLDPRTGAPAEQSPALPPTEGEEPAAPAPTHGAVVTYDRGRGSVQVKFPGRPDDSVLQTLRDNGFRWNRVEKVWYARGVADTLPHVRRLLGMPEPGAAPPKVDQPVKPPEPAAPPKQPEKPVRSIWTAIGQNPGGFTLYEDQRGVRSYIERGVRQTEAPPPAADASAEAPTPRADTFKVATLTDASRDAGIKAVEFETPKPAPAPAPTPPAAPPTTQEPQPPKPIKDMTREERAAWLIERARLKAGGAPAATAPIREQHDDESGAVPPTQTKDVSEPTGPQAAPPQAPTEQPTPTPAATPAAPEEPAAPPKQSAADRVKAMREKRKGPQASRARGRRLRFSRGVVLAPRGFERVRQHLTEQERAHLRQADAGRVRAAFDLLPPDTEAMTIAQAWTQYRDWYPQAADALRQVFGDVDAPRFAALLAATSPQQSVLDNIRTAARIWAEWTAIPAAQRAKLKPAQIARLMRRAMPGDVLPAYINNTVRALTAADPTTIVLSGPKVNSFMQNLVGHWHEVTNDVHMAAFWGVKKTGFNGRLTKKGGPGKRTVYLAVNAKTRRVAARLSKLTGETWTPSEVQATVWSWIVTVKQLMKAHDLSAEEVVRQGLVTDAAMSSAPRFHEYLTADATVRTILEEAGYGPELTDLSAQDTGRARPGDTGPAGAGGEAARGSRGKGTGPSPQELRAARRLDRVLADIKTPQFSVAHPAFFSALERAIADKMPAKASPQHVLGILVDPKGNPKNGVTKEELQWLGIQEWLAEQGGVVSKADVQQFIDANKLTVKEITLGGEFDDEAETDIIRAAGYDVDADGPDEAPYLTKDGESAMPEDVGTADITFAEPTSGPDGPEQHFTITLSNYYLPFKGVLITIGAFNAQGQRSGEMWRSETPWAPVTTYVTREQAEASLKARAIQRAEAHMEDKYETRVPKDVRAAFDRLVKKQPVPTEYSTHVLPGGENYREILIQLPTKIRGERKATRDDLLAEARRIGDEWAEGQRWLTAERARTEPEGFRERYDRQVEIEQRQAAIQEELLAIAGQGRGAIFGEGHYTPPNVLFHYRVNDRMDAQGRRVLFIEEIQSDWHQKARKKKEGVPRGYKPRVEPKIDGHDYEWWRQRADQILKPSARRWRQGTVRQASGAPGGWYAVDESGEWGQQSFPTKEEAQADLDWKRGSAEEIAAYEEAVRNREALRVNAEAVPDAPLKKTWHEFAMKRILRHAAENGYDVVAWTTGDQQNERYKLSDTVAQIKWFPHTPAAPTHGAVVSYDAKRGSVQVKFPGRPDDNVLQQLRDAGFRWNRMEKVWYRRGDESGVANTRGMLAASSARRWVQGERDVDVHLKTGNIVGLVTDPNGVVTSVEGAGRHRFVGEDLEDIIGKEVAAKIQATPEGELAAEGLDLGGHGMRGFYDRMMPIAVNKIGKPWKARTEDVSLGGTGKADRNLTDDEAVDAIRDFGLEHVYLDMHDTDTNTDIRRRLSDIEDQYESYLDDPTDAVELLRGGGETGDFWLREPAATGNVDENWKRAANEDVAIRALQANGRAAVGITVVEDGPDGRALVRFRSFDEFDQDELPFGMVRGEEISYLRNHGFAGQLWVAPPPPKGFTAHGVVITPEMREGILTRGFPMFARSRPMHLATLGEHGFSGSGDTLTYGQTPIVEDSEGVEVVFQVSKPGDPVVYDPETRQIAGSQHYVSAAVHAAWRGLHPDAQQTQPTALPPGPMRGRWQRAALRRDTLNEAYTAIPTRQMGDRAVPVYDTGQKLTREEMDAIFTPHVQGLVDEMLRQTGQILDLLQAQAAVERVGVLLDDNLHGVYWPSETSDKATILINVLEVLAREQWDVRGQHIVGDIPATPAEAAKVLFETIVHEVTHQQVEGHAEDFELAYAKNLKRIGPQARRAAQEALTTAYADPSARHGFHRDVARALSIYSASRGRRSATPDALSRAIGYQARLTDGEPVEGEDAGGVRPTGEGTPPGRDPAVVAEVLDIVDAYIEEGVTSFAEVAKGFVENFGEGAEAYYWALEDAWEMLQGEKVSVAEALPAQQNVPEQPDVTGPNAPRPPPEGPHGPLAGREETQPGTERPGGGPTPEAGNAPGVGPDHETQTEPGSGEGTGAGGTVPTETESGRGDGGRDSSLIPPFYRITDDDAVGTGTDRERISKNFAAIRLLKQLETENRRATPDEQRVLVQYVGWGGLSRIFEDWKTSEDRKTNQYWQAQSTTLRELMTGDEYAAARNSTQNAHYTSPTVVRAMWDAIRRLGVKSGSALEPSAGIGHFLGMAPDDMRGLQWAMVEKDDISSRIATRLYPGAFTQGSPFEESALPSGHFTVVTGNFPFGDIPITDRTLPGPPVLRQRIHNYFFAKSLEMVAPGGLIAAITSHGTLDSRDNTAVRQYLASKADFLGAIRLPNTAFAANAGTSVVTDIIFLRKRIPGETPNHIAPWIESTQVALPNRNKEMVPQWVNEYMQAHPEMVLGTHTSTGRMYRDNEYSVEPTGDLATQLPATIDHLPGDVINTLVTTQTLDTFKKEQPPLGTRPYEYHLHDGFLAQNIDGKVVYVGDTLPKGIEPRIRGLLPVRAALREVYDAVASDQADVLKAAQAKLTKAYEAFVAKFGFVSLEKNYEAFGDDPDVALLLSLEVYDDERETVTTTEIFTKKTEGEYRRALKAETTTEALHIALADSGRIDGSRVGDLLGISQEEALTRLEAEGLIIDTPTGYQLPSQYLSGNVRVKLREAEAAAQLNPKYKRAAERLAAVVPADILSHQIGVRLGVSWVPQDVMIEFVRHLVGLGGGRPLNWKVTFTELDGNWRIDGSGEAHTSPRFTVGEVMRGKGNKRRRVPLVDTKMLLLDALNDKRRIVRRTLDDGVTKVIDQQATLVARQKKEDLHKAFASWLFNSTPERRAWAVQRYNNWHNAYVAPTTDGAYLQFPGMAPEWRKKLRKHQRDFAARVLQTGNTLAAHVVGAGKTLALIATAMEMRRTGLSRKPMFVVPNHLLTQWARDIQRFYPNAKVLVAKASDLAAENRKRFVARVASGDWDAVVMPFSSFSRVSMSRRAEEAYHKELLEEVETQIIQAWQAAKDAGHKEGAKPPPSVKQLEKVRDRIQAKLDKLAERPYDELLTFEQLGVDSLFVDESQGFKNLYFHTRQQASGIPQNEKLVQRATDMYLKVRYINHLSGYRNVVMASGTPISNTMAEVYVVQKYLQENALQVAGMSHFDSWLAQFGLISVKSGLDPSGTGLSTRPRLDEFRNLSDLSIMFKAVADVQLVDDLPEIKAARPKMVGGKEQAVEIPATDEQVEYLNALAERAANLDPRRRDLDNMAKITMDGRLAMLDMRMLDRRRPEDPNNKVTRVADEVAKIHKAWNDKKGTQLIFMDAGVPGTDKGRDKPKRKFNTATGEYELRPPTEEEFYRGFDLYADLKKKLIARGIPEDQIAFAHDADKVPKKHRDEALKAMFRKMQQGKIRVFIGSTGKIGTGMNVQDKLVALHNVDPTLKPSDIEQRLGRILRQGNEFHEADPENFQVHVNNYITSGRGKAFGFDAYLWALNARKAGFIADFYKGRLGLRNMKLALDQTVLTANQMKAIATNNPLIIEEGDLQEELQRLVILEQGWAEEQREAEWNLDTVQQEMFNAQREIALMRRTAAAVTPEDDPLTATTEMEKGKPVTIEGHKDIGIAVIDAAMSVTLADDHHPARWSASNTAFEFGTFRGLVMRIEGNGTNSPHISLRHPEDDRARVRNVSAATQFGGFRVVMEPLLVASHEADAPGGLAWRDPVGLVRRLNNAIADLQKPGFWEQTLLDKQARFEEYQRTLAEPFPEAAELETTRARLEVIQRELGTHTHQEEEQEVPSGEEEEDNDDDSADSVVSYVEGLPSEKEVASGEADAASTHGASAATGAGTPTAPASTPPRTTTHPTDPNRILRGIPFPELVRIAKELVGVPHIIRRFRNPGKGGEFRSPGGITLSAHLFRPGNEEDLARALAHEIGHLIDYLPDGTLKRGNLAGRLFSLQRFLMETFTAPDGHTVKNSVIRAELTALSMEWRPWNPETDTETYGKYRDSARELYADALSALLNDPAYLEEKAPTFFKEFFAGLDTKPAVATTYFATQDFLNGTPEEIIDARHERIRDGFKIGDQKSIDIERLRQNELKFSFESFVYRMRIEFVDKNTPMIDRVRALRARGIRIHPDRDPRYALEERSYLGGKTSGFVQQYFEPIVKNIAKTGLDWTDFGAVLLYERVIDGDRQGLANPEGTTPTFAKENLARLKSKLTPEQLRNLQDSIDAFRHAVRLVVDEAHQVGLYSDDLYNKMVANPAYATFRSIDYLEKEVRFNVYPQVGMLGPTTNPATNTIEKTLATIRAIERQKMLLKSFDVLQSYYANDIEQAKEVWQGDKGRQPVVSDDPKNKVLVYYYEKGKVRGKYVDQYIADSLNNASVGQNSAIVEGLRLINAGYLRPVYTTVNVGFQISNVVRDFFRFWKNFRTNYPDQRQTFRTMTLSRAIKLYWQAIPMAKVRAFGLSKKPSARQLQALDDLIASERSGLFAVTMNDFYSKSADPLDTVIEDTMAKLSVPGYKRTHDDNAVVAGIRSVYGFMKSVGDLTETLPKAAAILEYRGAGNIGDISPEIRSHIRRKMGSPDFLQGGTWRPFWNNAFLFSNATLQGMRSDMEVAGILGRAERDPKSIAGFWWKTVALNVVPKFINFMAIYGTKMLLESLGPDDDDEEKNAMRRGLRYVRTAWTGISEYRLTNFLSGSFGLDGKKNSIVFHLPTDQFGQLVGGLTWKMLRGMGEAMTGNASLAAVAMETAQQMFTYLTGQMPGMTTVIGSAVDAVHYAQGLPIRDDYRGQEVLSKDEQAAREAPNEWRPLAKFLGYEFQELGGGLIYKFYYGDSRPREKTGMQTFLDLPLLPLVFPLNRFISVTNYGHLEQAAREEAPELAKRAQANLNERDAVGAGVRQMMQLTPEQQDAQIDTIAEQTTLKLYPNAPVREQRQQFRDIRSKLRMGIRRGHADWLTDKVLSSGTNQERANHILRGADEMGKKEFETWWNQAQEERVISREVYQLVEQAREAAAGR